jgi:hypothetical protein
MVSVEKVERSLAFPVIDMRDLGDATEGDSHYNPYQEATTIWLTDPVFCSLKKLGHALGVDRIVLAEMTNRREPKPIGPSSQGRTSKDTQGIYVWNVSTATVDEEMNNWHLSSRQKSDVRKIVSNGGAVIMVSAFADDACEILSHELGHHISEFHAGFTRAELFTAPTNPGREDSRLDAYCRQNKAEFFAESFRFYLGGDPMGRIDLRPLLGRVRKNDCRAFKLLQTYRASAISRN